MDERRTLLGLFGICFDDPLVTQILEFTKVYGKQEKDCSFDLSNEKSCLFLGILLLSGYQKLPHCRMY